MAVQLISKAAYARHRGCDEKAVRKAIADGRISAIDGKIDPAVADIQWAQNTRARADSGNRVVEPAADSQAEQLAGDASTTPDPRANGAIQGGGGGGAPAGYNDLRTQRERIELERAQRDNDREAGRLIDRAATERAIFDAFRALRDAVMAAAPRAAPKAVGLVDARELEAVISGELRRAFEGWEAGMLARLPQQEGAGS